MSASGITPPPRSQLRTAESTAESTAKSTELFNATVAAPRPPLDGGPSTSRSSRPPSVGTRTGNENEVNKMFADFLLKEGFAQLSYSDHFTFKSEFPSPKIVEEINNIFCQNYDQLNPKHSALILAAVLRKQFPSYTSNDIVCFIQNTFLNDERFAKVEKDPLVQEIKSFLDSHTQQQASASATPTASQARLQKIAVRSGITSKDIDNLIEKLASNIEKVDSLNDAYNAVMSNLTESTSCSQVNLDCKEYTTSQKLLKLAVAIEKRMASYSITGENHFMNFCTKIYGMILKGIAQNLPVSQDKRDEFHTQGLLSASTFEDFSIKITALQDSCVTLASESADAEYRNMNSEDKFMLISTSNGSEQEGKALLQVRSLNDLLKKFDKVTAPFIIDLVKVEFSSPMNQVGNTDLQASQVDTPTVPAFNVVKEFCQRTALSESQVRSALARCERVRNGDVDFKITLDAITYNCVAKFARDELVSLVAVNPDKFQAVPAVQNSLPLITSATGLGTTRLRENPEFESRNLFKGISVMLTEGLEELRASIVEHSRGILWTTAIDSDGYCYAALPKLMARIQDLTTVKISIFQDLANLMDACYKAGLPFPLFASHQLLLLGVTDQVESFEGNVTIPGFLGLQQIITEDRVNIQKVIETMGSIGGDFEKDLLNHPSVQNLENTAKLKIIQVLGIRNFLKNICALYYGNNPKPEDLNTFIGNFINSDFHNFAREILNAVSAEEIIALTTNIRDLPIINEMINWEKDGRRPFKTPTPPKFTLSRAFRPTGAQNGPAKTANYDVPPAAAKSDHPHA